jgi:acetyl-CoA carboxylase biotin carboxyl carrier protein
MDLKNIQELIKLVKKSEISELSVKEGDFEVNIKNKGTDQPTYITSAPVTTAAAPVTKAETPHQETPAVKETPAKANNENLITFRSPMVGTFYRKPGADKDVYVKIGDTVKTGDVLCIIEAMKLFNEIEFDGVAGKIVKVLVEDSSPVEYDQPLFLIEKGE